MPIYDPYDIWSSPCVVPARRHNFKSSFSGKVGAVAIWLADWLFPQFSRWALNGKPRTYPIVVAQECPRAGIQGTQDPDSCTKVLQALQDLAWRQENEVWGWGLGFP